MILKIIHIILLASVKYIITLPYAMLIGLEYKYAVTAVLAGGIGGFLFFYYLSKRVNHWLDYMWPHICKAIPSFIKKRYNKLCIRKAKPEVKKIFSKKSRTLVHLKNTYGLWGIIIATPVLLTIPVGAFLASKYYAHQKHIVLYMILSIIVWGGILSGVIHLFPEIFF